MEFTVKFLLPFIKRSLLKNSRKKCTLQSFALDMVLSNIAIRCYNDQESLIHSLEDLFFSVMGRYGIQNAHA